MNVHTAHRGDHGITEQEMNPFIALLVGNHSIAVIGGGMGPRSRKRRARLDDGAAQLGKLSNRVGRIGVT